MFKRCSSSQFRGIGGIAIDLFRIKHLFMLAKFQLDRRILRLLNGADDPVKAGPLAHVATGSAFHIHAQPHGILVIIDMQLRRFSVPCHW